MENEKLLISFKNQILTFAGILLVMTVITAIILLIGVLKIECQSGLILVLAILTLCFLIAFILVLLSYYLYLKQLLEYQNIALENKNKREHENAQTKLNHEYRLEALKQDMFHLIVKEISEKKEINKNKNEKVLSVTLNHTLLEEIKKIKNEIDKI